MNAKPKIKLSVASRRVVMSDYTEPSERVASQDVAILTHSPVDIGVSLVAAQPFARPAQSKLQRSRVLARRPHIKRVKH